MDTRKRRFSIRLLLAATIGLVLTSVFSASPAGTAALVPSASAQPAGPSAASDTALTERVVPGRRPRVAAAPSALPTATEAPAVEAEAAIQLVALAPLTVDVWNAEERYYSIVGSTPDELVASATASVPADPTGRERTEMAYAGPIRWDHTPSYVQDASAGTCTMTALVSNVTYQATLPQWTASSDVPLELLEWWQVVLDHIRAHESQHVRIFEDYVSALEARVVGQPCSAWDAIIARWTTELVAAQSAFDAVEAGWEFPVYAGALDW